MKHTLPILATLAFASPVLAENNRQLDAHEHGVGELNIAFDGKTVAMELHAPGADIVGFEYEAESEEDRAAIDSAVAILAKPQELFVLPKGAECTVTQASAGLESEEEHDDHDEHAEGEGDHDDHAKGEEEHDEHEEHAEGEDEHDDHAKGEEEHDEHEEHAEGEDEHDEHDEASHTEFHAEYILTCGSPSAIDKIEFAYFEAFENARELEVQVITNSGAQAFEVERDEPTLNLRGMF